MTTPKALATSDLHKKHRLKRRLLRSLSSSRKKKNEHEDAATDSDDSEVDVQLLAVDKKNNFFHAKRLMDQTLEGTLLTERFTCPPGRLLPLAEAEIEPDDSSEPSGRFLKRQDSNSTIQTLDSVTARLAETNVSPERVYQKSVLIEKLSRIGARDEFSEIFTDENEGDSTSGKKKKKNLFVRFADEHGEQLEFVHKTITMYSQEENDWIRAIILLLSPKKKMFEFLHVSYNIYDKTSVGELINQLPSIATDEALKEQKYVGLLRQEGERELINTVSLQSYTMKKNEILIAVVDGHYGKAMLRMAKPVFSNKKVMKAVTKSRSKRIHVTELHSVESKRSKNARKGSPSNLAMTNVAPGSEGAVPAPSVLRPRIHHRWDDDEDDIPDMSESFHHEDTDEIRRTYLAKEGNKEKVTLTRFLNAGLMTAVVYGLQRRLHRGSKTL